MAFSHRIGVDENGLGARLGPLVVTAVLASVTAAGEKTLNRALSRGLKSDLGDSKRLVRHGDVALGEAWARALSPRDALTPAEVFEHLSLEGLPTLRAPCPDHVASQCWSLQGEAFGADDEVVHRLRSHVLLLEKRGVRIQSIKSSVVCTRRLNDEDKLGRHRFIADLHAMERLVLALQKTAGGQVLATCGKVGGIADYVRYFGPLSDRLCAVLCQDRQRSAYRFPGLGELHFLRDADASDPLVMLASLVGKWVRELLMDRVARFYADPAGAAPVPSGYNDPVTKRFVEATALVRRQRRVPDTCFMRHQAHD